MESSVVEIPNPNVEDATLCGVFDLHDGSKRIVVICHGLLDHRDAGLIKFLGNNVKANCFRFDFAGNGDSGGEFSYGGYRAEVEDLRTVVQHLRSLDYEVVAIMGHSKGAAAVLQYAAIYNDVPKVVNISGRFDMTQQPTTRFTPEQMELLEREGSFTWHTWRGRVVRVTKEAFEERLHLDTTIVRNTNAHVLTVHGGADTVIPIADALRWGEYIVHHELCVIEGADHSYRQDEHKQQLVAAIDKFLQE